MNLVVREDGDGGPLLTCNRREKPIALTVETFRPPRFHLAVEARKDLARAFTS